VKTCSDSNKYEGGLIVALCFLSIIVAMLTGCDDAPTYSKDPAIQICIDKGGVPIENWIGMLKTCEFAPSHYLKEK